MAGADTKGVGLQVDGLREAINALAKLDKKFRAEAVDILREGAKKVQALAQSNIGKGLYRGPTPRGMVGRSATSAGAAIRLRQSKYPESAYRSEYGEKTGHVFGHPTRQTGFKRRTANPFSPPTKPNNILISKGGYVIQPAIRKLGPKMVRAATVDMSKLINRVLRNEMR